MTQHEQSLDRVYDVRAIVEFFKDAAFVQSYSVSREIDFSSSPACVLHDRHDLILVVEDDKACAQLIDEIKRADMTLGVDMQVLSEAKATLTVRLEITTKPRL